MGHRCQVTRTMGRKTTIELREPLLDAAQETAAREGTTLRALVEEGLELVMKEHRTREPFSLRKATYKGKGVQSGVQEGNWAGIRSLIYEGRGD